MKIIVSESQYKKIIHSVQEQSSALNNILNLLLSPDEDEEEYDDNTEKVSNNNIKSDNNDVIIDPGSYFVKPGYDKVTIEYGSLAVKLNNDAEILLKSIAYETGMDKIFVISTLRTYQDQARVNKKNNRLQIKRWYCRRNHSSESCNELLSNWDKLKSGEMSEEKYAQFLKDRDSKLGTLISNHIPGYAIDIVPYNQKLVDTTKKIKSNNNSGIKSVFPELDNDCVHLEFVFPVTGQSGVTTPKLRKKDKSIKNDVIEKGNFVIDTRNPKSNEYSLVYGGYPSSNYGGKFMYEQGKNESKLSNTNVFYSDKELPISSIELELKKINPDAKIKSVSGFSGGGPKTLEAMNSGKYKFIGLIDPYIKNPLDKLPNNTKMISNHSVWSGYPEARSALKKMEQSGVSEFIATDHLSMPKYFFKEYGDEM